MHHPIFPGIIFPPLPRPYFKPINLSLKISFGLIPTLAVLMSKMAG